MQRFSTKSEKAPIPVNRSLPVTPAAVRDFAVLLAEIAIRQLRQNEKLPKGDHPHA